MLRAVRKHVADWSFKQAIEKLGQRTEQSFAELGKIRQLSQLRKVDTGYNQAAIEYTFRDGNFYTSQTTKEIVPERSPTQILATLSFDEFCFEADVLGSKYHDDRRKRLVDQRLYRHDFKLWQQILEFRARMDGVHGIRDVWKGLCRRRMNIPTRGNDAELMWETFSKATCARDVFKYAQAVYKRTRRSYQGLYTLLVKPLLNTKPALALQWGRLLKKIKVEGHGSLIGMVDEALQSQASLKAFRTLYVRHPRYSLYDKMVPALCEAQMMHEALSWHRFLISVNDKPSYAGVADKLWCFYKSQGDTDACSEIVTDILECGLSLRDTALEIPIEPDEQRNTLLGNDMIFVPGQYFGPTPATLSDEHAARAFATSLFGLATITLYLSAFGLEKLGPLAMRELAIRCKSPQEVSDRVRHVESKRIIISSHAFCRLVQQLAAQDDPYLLDSVLQSDLHPDVFDDRQTQRKLLRLYLAQKDWPQFHRTLYVLQFLHQESTAGMWNLLLHQYMREKDWIMIKAVSSDMLQQGIHWKLSTIRQSFYLLLPTRKPGKRPASVVAESGDHILLVANLWLNILAAGGQVPPGAWRQIYVYMGMEGRLADLDSLTMWLIHYYAKDADRCPLNVLSQAPYRLRLHHTARTQRQRSASPADDPIRQLFPPAVLRAIIEWGIKSLGKPMSVSNRQPLLVIPALQATGLGNENTKQWTRGLQLLSLMHRRGVPIHKNTIRRACVRRFRILFGGQMSSKKENRIAVARNPYSLAHMVTTVNRIWHEKVFVVPVHVLRDEDALKRLIIGDGPKKGKWRLLRRPLHPAQRRRNETNEMS